MTTLTDAGPGTNGGTSDEDRVRALCARLLEEAPPATTPAREFWGRQFDLGLAWVHFAEGDGGLGLSYRLQAVIDETLAAAGAPRAGGGNVIGHGMGAPTVATHGSEAQKRRYLRPLFTNEEYWCQLFSEPGAGSDVASLSARAERDGDEWVLNGQKVWTTVAHLARFGMVVARTDPQAPKHKGLTYFVVDMTAPGVEVRPLVQITGEAEFNEVYFTDVRIPDGERLGEVGEGWRVAITTLMNERVAIGGQVPPKASGHIARLLEVVAATAPHTEVERDRVTRLYIRSEVQRLTNVRAAQARAQGTPGPEGSIGKLAMAELNKAITETALDLTGPEGMLFPAGYPMSRPRSVGMWDTTPQAFLRARANSIEGGTTEIMKNILAERVLGLPGDVRVDKDRPWAEVPRS